MTDELQELRGRILDLVAEFHDKRQADLPAFQPGVDVVRYAGRVYGPEELVKATDAVLDFWLTAGRFAEQLESELAEYVGVEYGFLVNSGSSANLLAVTALTSHLLEERRLRPGDEVITVAAGFPTTVAPIVQNRLVPVFVDVDIGTYNALPERIADAVSPKTKAIVLAHTLGNPWNLDAILDIAKDRGLWVVEDNCDALGSLYRQRRTGSFGHLATCSFYPAHHMTLGEGGAVLTDDDILARAIRSLRDWGRDCYCGPGENNTCGRRFEQQFGSLPFGYDHKYVYSHIGYNLKVTDIQAAIGCAQIRRLDDFGAARRANFQLLSQALADLGEFFVLPHATEGADPSWFAFPITVRQEAPFSRTELTRYLDARKIETRNLFSGNLLRHPAFEGIEHRVVGSLENSDRITNQSFFVGVYPGLGPAQLNYVAEVFHDFVAERSS